MKIAHLALNNNHSSKWSIYLDRLHTNKCKIKCNWYTNGEPYVVQ